MSKYLGRDTRSIQKSIVEHVEYTLAMTRFDFSHFGCFQAVAYSLRDRMLESYNDTNSYMLNQAARRISIISPEYAIGRMAPLYLLNNNMWKNYATALAELDFKLCDVLLEESDFDVGIGPSFSQT
jgi:starch phosphorylase